VVRFIRAYVSFSEDQGRQAAVGIMQCKGGATSVNLVAFPSLSMSHEKETAGWEECATRSPTAQVLHSARPTGTAWASVERPAHHVVEMLSD
jgi:hypothetical protein